MDLPITITDNLPTGLCVKIQEYRYPPLKSKWTFVNNSDNCILLLFEFKCDEIFVSKEFIIDFGVGVVKKFAKCIKNNILYHNPTGMDKSKRWCYKPDYSGGGCGYFRDSICRKIWDSGNFNEIKCYMHKKTRERLVNFIAESLKN